MPKITCAELEKAIESMMEKRKKEQGKGKEKEKDQVEGKETVFFRKMGTALVDTMVEKSVSLKSELEKGSKSYANTLRAELEKIEWPEFLKNYCDTASTNERHTLSEELSEKCEKAINDAEENYDRVIDTNLNTTEMINKEVDKFTKGNKSEACNEINKVHDTWLSSLVDYVSKYDDGVTKNDEIEKIKEHMKTKAIVLSELKIKKLWSELVPSINCNLISKTALEEFNDGLLSALDDQALALRNSSRIVYNKLVDDEWEKCKCRELYEQYRKTRDKKFWQPMADSEELAFSNAKKRYKKMVNEVIEKRLKEYLSKSSKDIFKNFIKNADKDMIKTLASQERTGLWYEQRLWEKEKEKGQDYAAPLIPTPKAPEAPKAPKAPKASEVIKARTAKRLYKKK